MKKLSIILLTFMTMATTINAQNRTEDEAAIKQVMQQFEHSWNSNDFSDMKNYVTPGCNWVNVVGMRWNGLKEVQFAHQAFANTMFKGVKIATVSHEIHFIGSDVAVAYWLSHIDTYYINQGKVKAGDGEALATIVFVKQQGKWMIRSLENVDVNKEAAPHNPVLHMHN